MTVHGERMDHQHHRTAMSLADLDGSLAACRKVNVLPGARHQTSLSNGRDETAGRPVKQHARRQARRELQMIFEPSALRRKRCLSLVETISCTSCRSSGIP